MMISSSTWDLVPETRGKEMQLLGSMGLLNRQSHILAKLSIRAIHVRW